MFDRNRDNKWLFTIILEFLKELHENLIKKWMKRDNNTFRKTETKLSAIHQEEAIERLEWFWLDTYWQSLIYRYMLC